MPEEETVSVGKTMLSESLGENQSQDRQSIPISQEATRAKIAWGFTQIFLLIVIIALILPTIISIAFPEVIENPITTSKELITLVASVLAGPFGFIVGFYFKERENV